MSELRLTPAEICDATQFCSRDQTPCSVCCSGIESAVLNKIAEAFNAADTPIKRLSVIATIRQAANSVQPGEGERE